MVKVLKRQMQFSNSSFVWVWPIKNIAYVYIANLPSPMIYNPIKSLLNLNFNKSLGCQGSSSIKPLAPSFIQQVPQQPSSMANPTARSFLQVAATEEVASPLRVVQIEGLVMEFTINFYNSLIYLFVYLFLIFNYGAYVIFD